MSDALRLANRSVLAEKAAISETWARILYGKVPEFRLPDAFDRAFDKKTAEAAATGQKPFPVDAYDLAVAWKEIEREEAEELERREREKQAENRVLYCPNRANHNQENLVAYADPYDRSRDVWLPCADCRFKAFQQAMTRYKEKHQDAFERQEQQKSNVASQFPKQQTGEQIERNVELVRSGNYADAFQSVDEAIKPKAAPTLRCPLCGRKILASAGTEGEMCGFPIEFDAVGGEAVKLCPGKMTR